METLNKETETKSCTIQNVTTRFESGVLDFLSQEKTGSLYILSDFYYKCLELLNLPERGGDYNIKRRKIQYRLNKMRKKGLIDCRRVGTGFLGGTDVGFKHHNCYTLPNFWL